ncbi:MAG: transcription termination/antitermination protein NusG, partial [Acholeplasmataceae bacterium]
SRFPQRSIHEAQGRWWVAKVKPRQEKALAFDLMEQNIEYYLPMYMKVVRRQDNNKKRKSILCLFPGYLSFCAEPGQQRHLYATGRIVNLVEIQHQSRFMKQLEQVYHTIDLGIPVEPWEDVDRLVEGTPVQVESGPLRGISGTVVRTQRSQKLVISVDALGRAAITVDAHMVKPVPST